MMRSIGGQWQLAAQNKRKEKARIAARARRSQEANLIMEMASELCLTQEKMRRIDKSTIIKLAIDYLKAFDILCRSPPSPPPTDHHQSATPSLSTATITPTMAPTKITPATTTTATNIPNTTTILDNITFNSKINQLDQQQLQQMRPLDSEQQEQMNPRKRPSQQQQQHQQVELRQQQQQQLSDELSPYASPVLTTSLIFAPKTHENDNKHFLMIDEEKSEDKLKFVLKPDTEISDEDDLTHLAPQAGDMSILLDVQSSQMIAQNILNRF